MSESFYLGKVQVDVRKLSLTHPEYALVVLQNKPIEVLHFLATQFPRLVSRDEIIDSVWDGNHYVGDKALTNVIWQLRHQFKLLGILDAISTVRKKGYRLEIAPIWEQYEATPGGEEACRDTTLAVTPATPSASFSSAKVQTPNTMQVLPAFFSFRVLFILGVFVVAVFLWLIIANSGKSAQAPYQLDSVLEGSGRAMHPSVSPDGTHLVFTWQKLGQPAQLYLQQLHTPDSPRQLTFGSLAHGAAVWSRDGKRLYFSTYAPEGGHCRLKQLTMLTLHTQVLADCWQFGRVYLDVSSDGRYLAFTGYLKGDGQGLYLIDLHDPHRSPTPWVCPALCDGMIRDVAFSADGRLLALTRRFHRLSEDVFLYDLQTGHAQQLTFGEEDIIGVKFHPDSQRLLYSAFQHGQRQGYIADLASNKITPLQVPNFGSHSAVTANKQVFFHQLPHAQQLAYVPWQHDLAAGIFPLTASNHRFEMMHFSSKRNALTYVTNTSGKSELWLAGASMQNAQQLTHLGGGIKYPQWSHSGDHIVFVTRLPDKTQDQIMIIEVETGKLTQIETGMKWHGRPSWQADDQAILFSFGGQLHEVELGSQQVRQLTSNGGLFAQAMPNGALLFTKGLQQGLWQRQPDGTEQQLLKGENFSTLYAWSFSQNVLAFLHNNTNQLSLAFYDLAALQPLSRVVLPQENISMYSGLSFDADLRRVYLEVEPLPRIDLKVLTHPLLK